MPNRKENFFICRIHKCVGKADDESNVQVYTALYVKPCVEDIDIYGVDAHYNEMSKQLWTQ